jgi:single-strand DNA-binding protein
MTKTSEAGTSLLMSENSTKGLFTMTDTIITIIGNLTADPELRFTPSGAAVANFTVASTPRTFDKATNEWKNGETMFLNCSVWRQVAENVAESLSKGMAVIVQGKLKSRTYETQSGERRVVFEVDVDEVGPSLKYASAKVTRNPSSGGSGQGGSSWESAQAPGERAQPEAPLETAKAQTPKAAPTEAPVSDPWADA